MSKNLKSFLSWVVVNGLFVAALFFGVLEKQQWAINLLWFFIPFQLVVSVFTYLALKGDAKDGEVPLREKWAKAMTPMWLRRVDSLLETAILLFLVAQGWFGFAIIHIISLLFVAVIRAEGDTALAEMKKADEEKYSDPDYDFLEEIKAKSS